MYFLIVRSKWIRKKTRRKREVEFKRLVGKNKSKYINNFDTVNIDELKMHQLKD